MSYTDELIRQELERYKTDDIPINDDEVGFFKKHVQPDTIETFKEMLIYVHGRSWYWSRLMKSVNFLETMTPENIDSIIEELRHKPLFALSLHVAMYKLCGFKIEVKEEIPVLDTKPVNKSKHKKKGKYGC